MRNREAFDPAVIARRGIKRYSEAANAADLTRCATMLNARLHRSLGEMNEMRACIAEARRHHRRAQGFRAIARLSQHTLDVSNGLVPYVSRMG